jgi:hypothetical protein
VGPARRVVVGDVVYLVVMCVGTAAGWVCPTAPVLYYECLHQEYQETLGHVNVLESGDSSAQVLALVVVSSLDLDCNSVRMVFGSLRWLYECNEWLV